MMRLFPNSLFGQTLFILLAGLIVSQLAGSWIYSTDRDEAVRAIGGMVAAERIANLGKLVREAPTDWRDRIVAASSDPSFQVEISAEPAPASVAGNDSASATALSRLLVERLSLAQTEELRVFVLNSGSGSAYERSDHDMNEHDSHESGFPELRVSIPLRDSKWLTVATVLPGSGMAFSQRFFASMTIMALVIGAVSIWVVRRVTAPLAYLSRAAHRLGQNLNAPPMPEVGTIETVEASRAFNAMQARLRSMIDDRTKTLAAISHDFRTPLTLLKLRVENVEDSVEREKMLSTIADLNSMVSSTLEYAGGQKTLAYRPTDLSALVASVVDDLADNGFPAKMLSAPSIILACDPAALKRAITNLLDNAVKYAGAARASLVEKEKSVEIRVEDDGPGIPEDKLSHVLEPLYRLEESRNRETGGMGLGLSIAQSITQAHGGQLTLRNRNQGGVCASIILPRPSQS